MAVYSFSQVVSLIRRAVLAEKALAELTLDYQLLQDDARTQVAKLEQQRDEYAEGYARQRDKVEKLEQQLSDADTHIDALQSVKDAFKRIAARRYARLAELKQQIKANEGVIELQAKRLATARMQFDSISKAAGAWADAKGLDP